MLIETLEARAIPYVLLEGGLAQRLRRVESLLGPAA
jgi:hypothetical protein